MLKRQNIKYKVASYGSGLLLLLLAFMVINPVVATAYAEDVDADYDNQVASLADTPSTVGISFSPEAGSASLTPTTSAGQFAQIKVLATVNVQKSGGYSVYVKSNSPNLVGQNNSSNIIPGLTGSSTYANLPVNTWGYTAVEGDAIPDNASYKVISTSGNGDKITENTSNRILNDTKTIALGFATRVNDEKPSDTYQNTVTMSVISSPLTVAVDFGIETMQQMTSAICANATDFDKNGQITGQLKDVRDGKYYWVSKLADGNCWMTQNLDLDLSAGVALTPEDSDVTSDWTPEFTTFTEVNSETINVDSQTETRSWSLGNVRIANPTEDNSCGQLHNDALQCTEQFVPYDTPTIWNGDELAHYILGNHYQWNTATAGTGGSITGGRAESSVCSKGWQLPVNGGAVGGLNYLLSLGKINSDDMIALTSAPYYFVRGGYVNQTHMFAAGGGGGDYWSSTPSSDADNAYYLSFSTRISAYNTYSRNGGFSIRCVAR